MKVLDSIVKLSPINRLAALVTGKGHDFIPSKKVLTGDCEVPLPTRNITWKDRRNPEFEDLTGRKFGQFTVIGLSAAKSGRWVVRCSCGIYTLRATKACRNPNNDSVDCCEHCRHLNYLKREDHYRRTGRNQ